MLFSTPEECGQFNESMKDVITGFIRAKNAFIQYICKGIPGGVFHYIQFHMQEDSLNKLFFNCIYPVILCTNQYHLHEVINNVNQFILATDADIILSQKEL